MSKILHGLAAVAAVEEMEDRQLRPEEKRVVMVEGYSRLRYLDTKQIWTRGVGQTGKWIDKTFREAFDDHWARVVRRLPDFEQYSEYVRCELMAAEYRGTLGGSPKCCMLIRSGQWEKAAAEFLDNAEYRDPETPESIKRRMRAVYNALMLRGLVGYD
jgi:GH24 family phage-related lysozyme (muramidase)